MQQTADSIHITCLKKDYTKNYSTEFPNKKSVNMLQPTDPQLIELCTKGFELHGFYKLKTPLKSEPPRVGLNGVFIHIICLNESHQNLYFPPVLPIDI